MAKDDTTARGMPCSLSISKEAMRDADTDIRTRSEHNGRLIIGEVRIGDTTMGRKYDAYHKNMDSECSLDICNSVLPNA